MLRVGVGIVVLILGDVVALELHVLLRAGGGTLNPSLPSASRVWLRPLVEALSLYLQNFQKQLCDTQKRRNRTSARLSSEVYLDALGDLVLQGEPQGVHVGDELLDSRVAASEAGEDEAREALDLLPDVGTPGDPLASSLPSGRGSRAVRHAIGQCSHRGPSPGSNPLDELHGDLPGGGLEAVEILEDFGRKPVAELAIFLLLGLHDVRTEEPDLLEELLQGRLILSLGRGYRELRARVQNLTKGVENVVAVGADREGWQLPYHRRKGERDRELLSQVLLVSQVADLLDQDADDLEVGEDVGPVTKELVEKLEHGLQADHGALEVGALTGSARALAEVVEEESADGLQEFQRIHLIFSALREPAVLAHVEEGEVLRDPFHEFQYFLPHLEGIGVVLR